MERPWLFDSPFKLQMNNQGIFSSKELNQQIHESVENICLVEITNCVYCKNMLWVHNGKPSRDRVDLKNSCQKWWTYWNNCQNSDDLELNLGFVEVSQVLYDLISGYANRNHSTDTSKFVDEFNVCPLKGVEWRLFWFCVYNLSLGNILGSTVHFNCLIHLILIPTW